MSYLSEPVLHQLCRQQTRFQQDRRHYCRAHHQSVQVTHAGDLTDTQLNEHTLCKLLNALCVRLSFLYAAVTHVDLSHTHIVFSCALRVILK